MSDVAHDVETAAPRRNEAEMCARLEAHFRRLEQAGRCLWQPQVRMILPALPGEPTSAIRRGVIDYVVELDGGLQIGVEAKMPPGRVAGFGEQLRQAHDYTRGVVAPFAFDAAKWKWQHLPLYAVFLAVELPNDGTHTGRALAWHARRIMSPFGVGFVTNHRWQGLHLSLGGEERWWSEKSGYRTDAFNRAKKLGSGKRGTWREGGGE